MKSYMDYIKLDLNPEVKQKLSEVYAAIDNLNRAVTDLYRVDKLIPVSVFTKEDEPGDCHEQS